MFKALTKITLSLSFFMVSGVTFAADYCHKDSGYADSYVLALSSQAGFCQTYGYDAGKKECQEMTQNSPYLYQFTLHGLWPNQDACGTNYGFCNTKKQRNFCDYESLNLSTKTADALKAVMPSYNYGTCLARYEWNKHGSCQALNQDDYFGVAIDLVSQINSSNFGLYFKKHVGQTISLHELESAFDQSFGSNMHQKLYLNCKQGVLVDLYIELPLFDAHSSLDLKQLLPMAPDAKKDHCPSNFKLSDFHV
ncbi:MAG: ribonuclease T2 family protein [Francisellaceae bacterium]